MSTDQSNPYLFRVLLCIAVCCVLFLAVVLYPSVARYIFIHKNVFNAAAHGTVEDVKYFMKRGVDVNAKGDAGWTPLHFAVMNDTDADVMKYLIERRADVSAKDNKGRTPLHYAASSPIIPIEVLKYLIDNGADVNAKDDIGQAPLDWASDKEKQAILRDAGGNRGEELPE